MYELSTIGVPVRKIHTDNQINMSVPTFTTLLEYYEKFLGYINTNPKIAKVMEASLFPDWLIHEVPGAQEQPETWKYVGRFPVGAWLER